MAIALTKVGVDRRGFVLGAAGALMGAGLAPWAWPNPAEAATGPVPLPEPIPGGLPIGLPPPYDLIHLFLPGDPNITLPFSGLQLMGEDVEPTTITHFDGETAMAYLIGSATGSDGVEYGLEVDLRISEGEFVDADGNHHRGTFGML
jgi:hypothetical protein